MTRSAFVQACLDKLSAPYTWGAHGPLVFDCSGLVTWALVSLGGKDFRQTHNAQRLCDTLLRAESPKPGDLAFYGFDREHVSHVMVLLANGEVVGACGGNRDVTSAEIAKARGARVRIRSNHLYRPDFLGFGDVSPLLNPA